MPKLTINLMNRNLVVVEKIIKRTELLRIHLEGRLNFDVYINMLIKKVSKKLLQRFAIN